MRLDACRVSASEPSEVGPVPIAYLTAVTPQASPFIMREIRALRRLGWDIHTFAIRRATVLCDSEPDDSPTFHVLPAPWFQLILDHGAVLATHPIRYMAALWFALTCRAPGLKQLLWQVFYFVEAVRVWRQVRQRGIRHVHVHFALAVANVAMVAGRLGQLNYSLTVHGSTELFNSDSNLLVQKVNYAQFVACISSYCRAQLLALTGEELGNKLHVVHCALDPQRFAPRRTGTAANGRPVVLTVGRLNPVKGHGVLLHAIREVVRRGCQLECRVAGDGSTRPYLQALIHKLDLMHHVSLVGNLAQPAILREYDAADIFVLPSFAEGLPVVLMEAMAKALPVVATRIAGIPELVDDGINGILVLPADVAQLADAIERLCEDSALRARLGARARQKVAAQFHVQSSVAQLNVLLRTGALRGECYS